ncbi:AbrB family transcriptional regulator [Roseitranquillus sediminis]|uniref:AbrB family transcriptional regulator n=1 Tax=Roseitranquillus sediminis TaxID=2809051 RepID=UPI001D0C1CF7|nr:AbrB family transcriptional regulator [Roseitranquillus sediminis]MBM9595780.1 AbrB family transcriptional regulator [Roseitranquillus sediminis]
MGQRPASPRTSLSPARRRLLTLVVATAGTAAFWALNLPLPFLFGPMSACLLGALVGAPLRGMEPVSKAARTIVGVTVGSSVTPAVVDQLPQTLGSLALIPVYIVLIGLIGVPFFTRICGLDRVTAYYAAMPGGLQDMVVFGQEAGADVRALSLIHATRILILIALAPWILMLGFGVTLGNQIGESAADLPMRELALMAAAAIIGWKGGERIGLFGAAVLGPMILTVAMSLTGLIHSRPPAEAIVAAQFFIGIGIGIGYVGVTLQELRKYVLAAVAFVLVLAVIAAGFTEVVVLAGFAQPLEGFLAYAPGGQAEMTILAILADADLGFVIVHHVSRVMLVITGAPIVWRLLRQRGTS